MTGIEGTTKFEPYAQVTRAMVIETLYKMERKPIDESWAVPTVKDYNENDWWSPALTWAMANQIATGNTYTNTFDGNKAVTRQEVATFLYRYAEYKGINVAVEEDAFASLEGVDVSDWAVNAFAWIVEKGIITGIPTEDGLDLAPTSGADRAQLATILQRFTENK